MAHLYNFYPIKTSIYKGFSMAMLNNQMVYNPDFPALLKWQVVWIAHFPRGGKHGSDREGRWDPGKAFQNFCILGLR